MIDVITCDNDADKYLEHYLGWMNLIYLDVFVQNLEYLDNLLTLPAKDINKRFITTTWRFTTARAALCAILPKDDSHIGWHFNVDFDLIEKCQWLKHHEVSDLSKRIRKGITELNAGAPWPLDCKYTEFEAYNAYECVAHNYPENVYQYNHDVNPVHLNRFALPLAEFYQDCFVDICIESRFAQPTGNYSEKVFQSMQFMTPFILVAPPFTLKILKDMGFQTFNKWWDESYDTITDHFLRMEAIVKVIDELSNTSINTLRIIYKEMQTVLQHNFDLAVKISKYNEIRPTIIFDQSLHTTQFANWDEKIT
jgi:hypothetical protein